MFEKPLATAIKMLVEAIAEIDKNHVRAVCLSAKAARLTILNLHALMSGGTFRFKSEKEIFIARLLKNFEGCVELVENPIPSPGVSVKHYVLLLSRIITQYMELILEVLLDQYNSSTRKISQVEVVLQSVRLAKCIIEGATIVMRVISANEGQPILTDFQNVEYESQKAKSDLEAFKGVLMNTYKDYTRMYLL